MWTAILLLTLASTLPKGVVWSYYARRVTTTHTFTGQLWAMPGEVFWVFVTMPADASAHIRSMPRPPRPGFGSIHVSATIGSTVWNTSIFPDSKSGCYVLPLKKAVRKEQHLEIGDTTDVTITLVE